MKRVCVEGFHRDTSSWGPRPGRVRKGGDPVSWLPDRRATPAFPLPKKEKWPSVSMGLRSPVTVAGPRRSLTGFLGSRHPLLLMQL